MDRLEFLEFAKLPVEKVAKGADRFALLAAACELAEADDFKGAEAAFNTASILFHPQDDWVFNTLYDATRCQVAWLNNKRNLAAKKKERETS